MSQTVVALPRLIELRSQFNNRLLRYVKEEGAFLKGFVQSYGEHAGSADVKFEVHGSTTGNNGLVHIRSCYNNKYLVLGERDFIFATAEKPEEDRSKRSCTLFRPTSVDGNPKKIRLTNVHLGKMLRTWSYGGDYANCVLALRSEPDSFPYDVFDVLDWQSLVMLPRYVAFKGDNGRFLRPLWFENQSYLQFSLTNVENDPMLAGNEIVQQTTDGTIRIRNMHWDTYWRLAPNWIWADSKNPKSDDELFEVVKYSDNKIALRNVKNKQFCTRLDAEGKESCLNAGSPTINTWAQLEVSDLVVSRKIENFKFRLMDARIYDESIDEMASSTHTNHATNTIQEWTFDLSHKEMQSRTWNANLSLKASIEMSFTVGIPLIEEGQVKMGLEFSGAYTWGETKEVEDVLSIQFKNPIPPQTKVTTRLMATRGTCDVPFTYTQRDVLYTGETVTSELDGVYTGINNYSYYTEVKEESLVKDPNIITDAGFKKVAKVSRSGVVTPI